MAPFAAPEPMNATTNHSKIRVHVTLPGESVVAGHNVTGKMEVECKSDKLGFGIIMVELFAFQELTSRDHSARMTFLHSRRLFQGPGLPPSNAVYAHALPGDEPLPEDYYRAKRGHSTFLFRIPLPLSSPASINFATGLAKVGYEVRGSVGVFWKGERQLVTDKEQVDVLESYEEDLFGFGAGSRAKAEEGVVVVGESGRFWMHGRVIGGLLLAGESACVELQVKNHSNRKNAGLSLSLNRTLLLPSTNPNSNKKPLQISDTILTVPYKGPEYILPPGGEGVAHLVFDVPLSARCVRGGSYEGDGDDDQRTSEALFGILANVEVKVAMGIGSKDIVLEIPATIVHPDALPDLPPSKPHPQAVPQPDAILYPQYTHAHHPNLGHHPHQQPLTQPYIDPQTQQVWFPPAPYPYDHPDEMYHSPHVLPDTLYPAQQSPYTHLNLAPRQLPPRPSSAGPLTTAPQHVQIGVYTPPISGLPVSPRGPHAVLLPLPGLHPYTPPRALPPTPTYIQAQSPTSPVIHQFGHPPHSPDDVPTVVPGQREEGKGAIATRISRHLRQTSAVIGRGRSVSPVAHRFGYSNAGGQQDDVIPVIESVGDAGVAVSTAMEGAGAEGTGTILGDVGGNSNRGSADPILHSPRPQIRHKQSFTNMNVNGQPVVRSESVIELEKIAAGLDVEAEENEARLEIQQSEEMKGKGKEKEKDKAASSPLPGGDVNMNKTLPAPPPATKSRRHGQEAMDQKDGNSTAAVTTSLESLFTPLPPPSLDSPQPTTQESSAPVPPTPTLVACKRPPRLPVSSATSGGGEAESGLDALERRLLAQVGTRKVDRVRKPDVRDILAAGPVSTFGRERGVSRSHPSTSTTPNLEGKPVQSGNGSVSASVLDESAISSLTLDQSSGGGGEGGDDQEKGDGRLKYGDEDDQEQEQESVDGGKTHKAGKSIVGVENYFQSRNHPPQRQQHRRENAFAESRIPNSRTTSSSKFATFSATTTFSASKMRSPVTPGQATKSNKSARTRGRVTAWLGKIDPDAPPPQEEIIPPSPSVVKPVEWDMDEKWDDDEGSLPLREGVKKERERLLGAFRSRFHTHSRCRHRSYSRSPSRSPPRARIHAHSPPSPPSRQQTTTPSRRKTPPQTQTPPLPPSAAASPNPRSSGFMPIEKMKVQRETVTKSLTRSMLRRDRTGKEMTIVVEARRVMDIWAEDLVDSPGKKKSATPVVNTSSRLSKKVEEKKPQYPFKTPTPPRTQTIRTDRRVSPPSAKEVRAVTPDAPILNSPSIPIDEKLEASRPTHMPVSYADVASRASSSTSNSRPRIPVPVKKELRIPVLAPSSWQDPEVKYDVRSARGGRGGKVTQVASLWASVAAGKAGATPDNTKGMEKAATKERFAGERKEVKGVTAVSSGAEVKTTNVSNSPSAPSPSAPVEAKTPLPPPLLLPKKSTARLGTSVAGPGASERTRPQSKTPTPLGHKIPTPTPKPKTPTPTSKPLTQFNPKTSLPILTRPLPSSSRSNDQLRSNRAERTKTFSPMQVPLKKAPSVPALVSSSLATPTLSSTASLVRPVGQFNSRTAAATMGLPGVGKGDYKAAVVSGGINGRESSTPSKVKESAIARKKPEPLEVVSEGAGTQMLASMRIRGSGSITTPTAVVGSVKPTEAVPPAETGVDLKRPVRDNTAFGQARLRDLIKKYQGGNV